MKNSRLLLVSLIWLSCAAFTQQGETLPNSAALDWTGDLSARMVLGLHRNLDRKIEESVAGRTQYWKRDFSSRETYEASVEPNRNRLKTIVGVVDERLAPRMERIHSGGEPAFVAETERYRIWAIRWQVLEGVDGEGLMLEPKGPAVAYVIALPDADQTPEQMAGLAFGIEPQSQFARRLAEAGCVVVIPTLIDRSSDFSGNPKMHTDRARMTNMPHREWLYRQAYQMGRHLIGYEVQKVLALVDWFKREHGDQAKVGVAGYGEGGLIALYAAALDRRIDTSLVSGYLAPRERVAEEPIYRNVWTLLREFGDAGIASLVLPRRLVIEHSPVPQVSGPPRAREGQRDAAAPGRIETPSTAAVRREFERIAEWQRKFPQPLQGGARMVPDSTSAAPVPFGSDQSLSYFLEPLTKNPALRTPAGVPAKDLRRGFDPTERQRRQVKQIENHVQHLLRISSYKRSEFFLEKVPYDSADRFAEASKKYRKIFSEEVIGKVGDPMMPFNPRSRKIYDRPKWTGYEVVHDVWPDVFNWGILLLPKDLKPGEKRPVVVVQHGLEGVPQDVIETDVDGYRYYKAFGAQLADRGFIVYSPHNPYRGKDDFRKLQFKANPLGLSLFSFIVGQHRQLLDWMKTLPNVDGKRIAFYGLSYGGKTAMRVPAILEDYCLSICSGDFNEWIWKNVTNEWPNSYMFTKEYEMYEFNLGMTFNYAEMAYLIFPRPFMVERGHRDGVGVDEWVAHEYAKVRRLYDELGHGDRTEIEFFNGVHEIHGEGTFKFLHRHLNWPEK
ncbi:MAG: dienelactone hydrolase family protein [Acidobacteriota bacterium]